MRGLQQFCLHSLLAIGIMLALPFTATSGTILDDFNDGDTDGWIFPYNSGMTQYPGGSWSVVDGALIQTFAGDSNTGLIDNLSVSDQIIEVSSKTIGYSGVVLWYQQVNTAWANYIAVSHNFQTGMGVSEMIDGVGTRYSYGGPWIGGDTYFDLSIDADSTTGELNVFLDGNYLFTHSAYTPYRVGLSGVYSGNAVTYFDDFMLSSDDIPPIPEPSTLTLLGIGILGLIGFRRHQ
jgi:hypothetical protein